MRDIPAILSVGPVIAILTIERADDALPLARALVRGGVRVLEVTLRTEAALPAIAAIARDAKDALIGAGTVLFEEQAHRAADAGAQFLVSPGLTQNLARAAASAAVLLLPGITTPSDIMRGRELGYSAFKFFPAEASGGVSALKAFEGPFADVSFCPSGGVTASNARDYLALGNVPCVGGSWLAPRDAIAAKDWPRIKRLARAASELRKRFNSNE